jgi:amino acid transporter/nucleotide-binding universal stress UspA family protein
VLCWAVVFADIGTSVYYVPGILYEEVGKLAATFVLLTGIAFVFLAAKYAEIASRYREGGGVVAVAGDAFGPYAGALGGMLITVDYFLTTAISSVSGWYYLSSLVPLGDWLVPLVIISLLLLGVLNAVGIKESASVTLAVALIALASDAVVVAVVGAQLSFDDWRRIGKGLLAVKDLGLERSVIGFAGAWLAFSGLESISQLAPAMASPRPRTSRRAILLVILTVLATSPILTSFATLLPRVNKTQSEQFISELGFAYGGFAIKLTVVLAASVLLLFAANTAIIGGYHVFRALAQQRFLPEVMARMSPKFGTPHIAIGVAVGVPILVVAATRGNLILLGHMYAFGLLGAFSLSSLGLDVVHFREGRRGPVFIIGALTTLVVVLAWFTNIVTKHLATLFGGGVTLLGILLAIAIRRGWLSRFFKPVPYLSRTTAEAEAAESPQAAKILTLTEARDLQTIYRSRWLVALRGPNDVLLRKIAERLKQAGETELYVLFVDEVPGILFPAGVGPSPEANALLQHATSYLERHGIMALPIWRVGHSAGETIAHTARELQLSNVVIGASRRTPMWKLLRGSVLRELNETLPSETELTIVR